MGMSPGGGGLVTVAKAVPEMSVMPPRAVWGRGAGESFGELAHLAALSSPGWFDALGWEVTPNTFWGPVVGAAGPEAHQIMGSNHTGQLRNIPICVPSLNLSLYLCKMQVLTEPA